MEIHNLVSLMGIFGIMAFAWLISNDRRLVNWRLIVWGVGLQLLFGLFVFVLPAGVSIFLVINHVVVRVIESASAGVQFVFGPLALPPGSTGPAGEKSIGFILATQALPTIVFFASFMAVLYHVRIMPLLVRGFATVFTRLMRVSGAESLCAASNIFVGVESALAVRPYLKDMTRSELHTILTAGMATVASNVLGLYVMILQGQFPTIAGHLVSASVLSAPAALVISKILLPEGETPETLGRTVAPRQEAYTNILEAMISGANAGLRLCVGIAALLLAFLGMVALLDLILAVLGSWVNQLFDLQMTWSFRELLGYLFYPFVIAMGIPLEDAGAIATLVGGRVVMTEIPPYQDLARLVADGALVDPRSAVVASYALCGFAHVASLAIFIGGIAALAPSRTQDLTRVGPRALIAATLACLMTGCIAGTFFSSSSILLGG